MSLFTTQKINIYQNKLTYKPGTRQPVNEYVLVKENVPCRITGTDSGNIVLFISKNIYETITEGIHKSFKIEVVGTTMKYLVVNEPIWAGGINHHIEINLEELI